MLSVVFRYGCKARGVIIESSLRRQWFDKISACGTTGAWSLALKHSLNIWIKILGSHFKNETAYWLIGAGHQTWLRNQTSSSCGDTRRRGRVVIEGKNYGAEGRQRVVSSISGMAFRRQENSFC